MLFFLDFQPYRYLILIAFSGTSKKLKKVLKDSELRDIIMEVDGLKNATPAINEHIKNSKFKEFSALCLNIIENPEDIDDTDDDF